MRITSKMRNLLLWLYKMLVTHKVGGLYKVYYIPVSFWYVKVWHAHGTDYHSFAVNHLWKVDNFEKNHKTWSKCKSLKCQKNWNSLLILTSIFFSEFGDGFYKEWIEGIPIEWENVIFFYFFIWIFGLFKYNETKYTVFHLFFFKCWT